MPAPRLTIDQLPTDTALAGTEWLIVQDAGTSKKVAVSTVTGINQTAIDAHVNDTDDAHDATAISTTASSGTINGTTVQAQLGQLATATNTNAGGITTNTTDIAAHVGDTTAAHAATAISATSGTLIVGADVQTQLVAINARFGVVDTETSDLQTQIDTIELTPGPPGDPGNDGDPGPTGPGVATGGTLDQVLAKASATNFDTKWVTPSAGGGGGITTEDAVDAVAAALVAGNNIDVTYNDASNTITIDVEVLTSADVGLGNVTNTSDANKPVSTAQAAADALKADKTITVTPSAPLTGGGDLSANRTLAITSFAGSAAGAVPVSVGGTTNFLRADGTWAAPPAGGGDTQTIETVSATTYTVVAADTAKIKRLTATCTVTLPAAGISTGQRVDFVSIGGPATFALSGSTWDVAPTPSAVARAIGSVVTAVKMGATTWMLTGDLA